MKAPSLVKALTAALSLLLLPDILCLRAQGAAGDVDLSFDPGSGVNGVVKTVALQPDGNVIIAGDFTTVRSLGRVNVPGAVLCCANALALQPDGKVLVHGVFNVNGTNRITFVRLNGDGSLDGSFNAAPAADGYIRAVVIQPDGKILIGRGSVVRLNANGSRDSSFNATTASADGGFSIALQPDGKVLTADGTDIRRHNADGSLDSTFNAATAANGTVQSLVLHPDGKMLIAGDFLSINGAGRKAIARLNADGSLDGNFQPGAAVNERVSALVAQTDGKVLMGGSFTTVQGIARAGIARLHADGSMDSTFNPAIKFYATASHIRSIGVLTDGKVLITGIFKTLNNTARTIARLHSDGSVDSSFQPDLTIFIPADPCPPGYWYCEKYATADTALLKPDGRVIISGAAIMIATGDEAIDYFPTPFLARFHNDGSLDRSFQFGAGITGASIHRMILQPDGKVLLTGSFAVNGASRGMIRLHADGSLENTFNPGRNDGIIRELARVTVRRQGAHRR